MASDAYRFYRRLDTGLHLVLGQRINNLDPVEWHLHQDLAIALSLKREGDVWVSPHEDYTEVVRLRRFPDGNPFLLEMKAEHLRDYLCARRMALYVTSYRSRKAIVEVADHISWRNERFSDSQDGDRWEGRVYAVREGAWPFLSTSIVRIARTGVDPEEDVPILDLPSGGPSIETRSWNIEHEGPTPFMIQGELWQSEWVEPAARSPRIRGDKIAASVYFISDAEGKTESAAQLRDGGKWLWFRPEVMLALSQHRGGGLSWYTRDTGHVRCSPDDDVHFGVNRIGLINVFAKDIAKLPDWQQKIWAGCNVGPEGGVSEELLASQVRAMPADTQAPETYLPIGLSLLRQLSIDKIGVPLLREHTDIPKITLSAHRFRAVDSAGFFALAKDLARLTADSIDSAAIQKFFNLPKEPKLGSLKLLEQLLATQVTPVAAKQLLGVLVGIYELRHADAHLPSSEVEDSLRLACVDRDAPFITQGFQILEACVSSVWGILRVVRDWKASNSGRPTK